MTDSKVSALTAKTTLTGAEEVYINDAGTSKKATVTNLVAVKESKFILASAMYDYLVDNTIEYAGFNTRQPLNAAEVVANLVLPFDITIKSFTMNINVNSSQTNEVNPVLRINGVDTALVISETLNVAGTYSVVADVDVDAGEKITVKLDNTGNTGLWRDGSHAIEVVTR